MIHRRRHPTILILSTLLLATAAAVEGAGPDSRSGSTDAAIAARVKQAYERARALEATPVERAGGPARDAALAGSWRVTVSSPDGTQFQALHTYNADGTFTETSNLLAGLGEGPAHGAWRGGGGVYLLTFELFAFEDGRPAGIVQVRNVVEVVGRDHLLGWSTADLLEPDGNLRREHFTATFEGTRIQALRSPDVPR